MKVLEKHPDFKVVAKPDSNWDATTSRNVTATMLQQNPDICAHHRLLGRRCHRHLGRDPRCRQARARSSWSPPAAARRSIATSWSPATFGAVVMTELQNQSRDMNAIIKFLLQSGQPPGTSKTYIYTLEKATTKADIKPDTCWDLKALQAAAK